MCSGARRSDVGEDLRISFHFKQNRNKKARQLDDESSQEFKDKCEAAEALLVAQTDDGYTVAMNDLNQFVKEKPDRELLASWLK